MLKTLEKVLQLDEYLDTFSEDELVSPEQEIEPDFEVVGIATPKIKKLFHLIVGTEIIYEESLEQNDTARSQIIIETLHFYDAVLEMEIRASYKAIKPENTVCVCEDWKVAQHYTEVVITYGNEEGSDEEDEATTVTRRPLLN